MSNKFLSGLVIIAVFMSLSATAFAQEDGEPEAEPGAVETPHEKDLGITKFYAKTGVGYDSNVFQAPSAPYVDYYAGSLLGGANPTVIPQRKSGFFVPYDLKIISTKSLGEDSRLLGSAKAEGRYYPASSVSYANQYTVRLRGGSERVLGRQENLENSLYFGALVGIHHETYTDHDTGLPKTTTVSGTDISNRYNYTSIGAEGAYKHKTGSVGYGVKGQYLVNSYDDPVVVSKLDNTFYRLAGDASVHVTPKTKLAFDLAYSVRDFSKRHSHDAQGVYSVTNPLLKYSFNKADAKLRQRLSSDWQLGFELGYTQRVDHFVHYNDYNESTYGARLQYKHEGFKAGLSLHHLNRTYPNAFAFDVAGMAQRTYSGNDVKLKVESEQSKNSTLWTELDYRSRNSTDLRYAYGRKQIMAGLTWLY